MGIIRNLWVRNLTGTDTADIFNNIKKVNKFSENY